MVLYHTLSLPSVLAVVFMVAISIDHPWDGGNVGVSGDFQ
jgi:hypothetical protein